jgi:HJR/Mrr/RecB family endonuclease
MYEVSGFQTVLTYQSNDGGADVVAVGKAEAWLIQAKHSAHLPTGPEAVDDLLAAHTVYQNAAFRPFKMAVISNAKFSAECARRASQCGISLLDGAELLRRLGESPVTMGEVVAREVGRAGTFAEGSGGHSEDSVLKGHREGESRNV